MKHAVLIGHPNPKSFTHAVANAYVETVRGLGGEVIVRDLYAMNFDPRLHASELPDPNGFQADSDVLAERDTIRSAYVFAFFYPLWFNAPPAIIKGYVDRIFGMGFGYSIFAQGGNHPLLTGRKMLSFTSSGSPKKWLVKEGAWAALRNLFDQHVSDVCGFTLLDHVHLGGVHPGMSEHLVGEHLQTVRATARRLFSGKDFETLQEAEDRAGVKLG